MRQHTSLTTSHCRRDTTRGKPYRFLPNHPLCRMCITGVCTLDRIVTFHHDENLHQQIHDAAFASSITVLIPAVFSSYWIIFCPAADNFAWRIC